MEGGCRYLWIVVCAPSHPVDSKRLILPIFRAMVTGWIIIVLMKRQPSSQYRDCDHVADKAFLDLDLGRLRKICEMHHGSRGG